MIKFNKDGKVDRSLYFLHPTWDDLADALDEAVAALRVYADDASYWVTKVVVSAPNGTRSYDPGPSPDRAKTALRTIGALAGRGNDNTDADRDRDG